MYGERRDFIDSNFGSRAHERGQQPRRHASMTEENVKAEEGGGFENVWAAMSTEELFQKSRRAV